VGKNGQGKTNILEAIYLCALSKSFRTQKNQDFIAFNQPYCTLKAQTEEATVEFIMMADSGQKTLKINGVKRTAIDFVGHLKAVFFSPDDLASMAFAPKLRRRYLDILLSQLSHDYLQALTRYEAGRKQRNALLKRLKKGEGKIEELFFWNEVLADSALPLLTARRALVKDLNERLEGHYQAISQSNEQVKVVYVTEMKDIQTKEDYLERLKSFQETDLLLSKTHFGPQRDDLNFFLEGNDMRSFSSRGEWRSLVLALKFAEIELIKVKTGECPLLLLDDVFSELDPQRQAYLMQSIEGIQTFITTTHADFFDQLNVPYKIYKVEEGEVI